MFYILSKTIYLIAMPLTWVFLLLIYSLLTKRKKRKRIALIATLFILYFCSNTYFTSKITEWWEMEATPLSQLNSDYEVGIVLGGMVEAFRKPNDRVYTKRGVDRLIQATNLWKKGYVDKLLVTGGLYHFTLTDKESEALVMKELLNQWGVPDSVIILEHDSKNTRENATMSKAVLDSLGYNNSTNYLLITSAFHMRRSKACFNKVGLELDTFTTDFLADQYSDHFWFFFECDADHFFIFSKIIHEMVGMAAYKAMGYI